MERPTIAIVTDDPAFANAITRRWLAEREVPAFVLMQSDSDFRKALDFDLAIAVRITTERLPDAMNSLHASGKPVILVSSSNVPFPRGASITCVPEVLEWPELVLVLAQQILQREHIRSECNRLREINSGLEQEASLGRYMREVSHNLNNALTSVLGNSDLILLDAEQLPASLRGQVETIRNMGMRMNEIMHRFSSLQKEMRLIEEASEHKAAKSAAASA